MTVGLIIVHAQWVFVEGRKETEVGLLYDQPLKTNSTKTTGVTEVS